MTIRALVILVAICFSANAFAKDKLPKVGNKPLVLVKPKEPTGCKLVGTVKGTKLWAGDCVASELRGATPATETESMPEQAPPGQKQQSWGSRRRGNDDATASAMDRSRGASVEDVGQEESKRG